MLTIAIDLDAATPVYQQIADGIRSLIARKSLVGGDGLPSVRKLGGQIGVNLNTVARAYRILADEGLVELRRGAAARVASPEKQTTDEPLLDDEARRRLFDMFSRWVLRGAKRPDIQRALKHATAEFFE